MNHTYDGYPPPTYPREVPTRVVIHTALVTWERNQGANTDSVGVKLFDGHVQDRIYFDDIRGSYPAVGGLYTMKRKLENHWSTFTFTPIERVP